MSLYSTVGTCGMPRSRGAASCELIRPPLATLSHLHICEISSRWWRWQDDVTANLAACDNQFRTNRPGDLTLRNRFNAHRTEIGNSWTGKRKKKAKTKTKSRELSKIHYLLAICAYMYEQNFLIYFERVAANRFRGPPRTIYEVIFCGVLA